MDENLPDTLHAIIYTSPSGGFVIGDRCKSLDCAINSIDPLGAGGETVYGRAIIDRVPGSALAFWKRHKEAVAPTTFQDGVAAWMGEAFVPSLYCDMTERGDRLLEEVLELLQAHGYDRGRVATLVDYVYGRPPGEPAQEVGGVMVTLAGFCWVAGLDMHAAGAAELDRINRPEVMAKIRAKQEAKNALHFDSPLPGADAQERAQ